MFFLELFTASIYFNRLNKAVSEVDAEGISYYADKIISKCSKALILQEITQEMFEVVETNLTKMQRVAKAKDGDAFTVLLPLYSQKMIWEKGKDSFFRGSFNEALCRIRPLFLIFQKNFFSIELVKLELAEILDEVNNYKFKVEDVDYFMGQLIENIYKYAGVLEVPEEAKAVCVTYFPKAIIKHISDARLSLLAKKLELPVLLRHLKQASMVLMDWESTLKSLNMGATFFKEKKELLLMDMGYKRASGGSDLFESKITEPTIQFKKGKRSIPLLNILKEYKAFSPEDAADKQIGRGFLTQKLNCTTTSLCQLVDKLNRNTNAKKLGTVKVSKTGQIPTIYYWITKNGLKYLDDVEANANV